LPIWSILFALLAGAALRQLFILSFPGFGDDSAIDGNLPFNHAYALDTPIHLTLVRLPGCRGRLTRTAVASALALHSRRLEEPAHAEAGSFSFALRGSSQSRMNSPASSGTSQITRHP